MRLKIGDRVLIRAEGIEYTVLDVLPEEERYVLRGRIGLFRDDQLAAPIRDLPRCSSSKAKENVKPSNPKDSVGIRKWRQFCCVPFTVIWHIGVAMLEGYLKYGRHNYRKAGVRASVYIDAAKGHIDCWWEGEDDDPDSRLCHLDKALASLVVLRDSMLLGNWVDDRPPKANVDEIRGYLQGKVEELFDKYPDPKPPFTEKEHGSN